VLVAYTGDPTHLAFWILLDFARLRVADALAPDCTRLS